MKKTLFLIAAILCAAFLVASCSNTNSNNTNSGNANNGNASSSGNKGGGTPASSPGGGTTASSGDEIGVPECDAFLKKYETCVNANVPEAQRAAFAQSMTQWRASWKQLAATPQGKTALVQACQQAETSSKQSLSAYNCNW